MFEEFTFVLAIALWTAVSLVAYAYVGYPLLLLLAARFFGRSRMPPLVRDDDLPHVSLLIAALNEEKWIGERIANALATLDLDIAFAKVATEKHLAYDIFYITEATGRKLTDDVLPRIETALYEALSDKAATAQ